MAGRKPIYSAAMSPTERRRKNDAERLARGELRITAWLSPEAAAALYKLAGENRTRATLQEAINEALIHYSPRKKRDASI